MTDDRELEEKLCRLRYSTTPALDKRILDAAMAARKTMQSRRAPLPFRKLVVRLSWTAAVAIAAIAVYWQLRPQPVWAQVVKNLRKQPWIRFQPKVPDGEVPDGEVPDGEMPDGEWWVSFERKMEYSRNGKQVRFVDYRLGITDTYDAKDNSITRTTYLPEQSREAFIAFDVLFQGLFHGDDILKFPLPGGRLVNPKRQKVNADGRQWIDLTWDVEHNKKLIQHLVIRIDLQTHLPHSMTISSKQMTPESMTMYLDYPKKGPADIYALGVPRDAKRIPKGELERIVEAVQRANEKFDDHKLLQIWRTADSPWYRGTPVIYWLKGKRSRLDYGVERPDFTLMKIPDARSNQRTWWENHLKQFWFAPAKVRDAQYFYFNSAKPADIQTASPPLHYDPAKWPKPKWTKSPRVGSERKTTPPLQLGYSTNITHSIGRGSVTLEKYPKDGPSGTIRIRMEGARRWVDPSKGYMTVRWEIGSEPANNQPFSPMLIQIVEDSARSPRGFWYPTFVRIISVEKEAGKTTRKEHVWQCYLDFDADMPDHLFKPTEHVIVD